ncbi:MAG: hypothetical protein AAFN07_02305 [Pseudomonadota bacterium]
MATSDPTDIARGPGATRWPRDWQKRAVLVWISFLIAAVMSLVFFGLVDPVDLLQTSAIDFGDGRERGYALLFFFFWGGTATSAWLALRLTRRPRS